MSETCGTLFLTLPIYFEFQISVVLISLKR